MLLPQEIIKRKRDGKKLSEVEIQFMIKGFVDGSVADYQMSALAMAIYFKECDAEETAFLLKAMIASGETFDWSEFRGERIFVDKHSTGGVGDKTSLVITPLLIADGLDVPMIAGRGLGHTGGTVDKLEAIPGFLCQADMATYKKWLTIAHGFFGAQTEQFVPADKKLYALRDVTSTVESDALIVASIMSKKLSEGLNALVLDVKFGSGAFMKELDSAKRLARKLVAAGEKAGCKVNAALTNMEEPLGRTAGNSIEVIECLDILQGAGPLDTRELSLQLAASVSARARGEKDSSIALHRMKDHLQSGRAFEIFLKVAQMQGASLLDLERKNTKWILGDTQEEAVNALSSGNVKSIDTRKIGLAVVSLGGGRTKSSDKINPHVGISRLKKIGEEVSSFEPLCVIHYSDAKSLESAKKLILESYEVGPGNYESPELIKEWI